ncbi:alpha-mannosidase [Butyrivibrio fibrisolvens]|uniref:alpha-mannosidase n=1 Tax=Butyrivibrio fibrisolvens TaxID=831 RepID=UPI00040B929E|nr:glycoside hydrolase family 38 C-terminal domain-containing protein [Butyrivibrio fibrisolvens]
MNVMHSEWRDRIAHWIRTLKDDFYEPLGEIKWEAARTMEELPFDDLGSLSFKPVEPGYTWGKVWEYCWFRGSVILPKEAEGKRIVMKLVPGGESTLFVNGKSFGTHRAEWVWVPHHYIEDNALTTCGHEGDRFDILMETYAGHFYPEAPSGGCATGPVLPGSYQDPLTDGARRKLGVCTYGIWDEDAYQLYMDVDTLSQLLGTLDQSSLRASKIAAALEEFSLIVDFEQDREKRRSTYIKAREALKPALAAVNGSTMPTYYAIGNSHLDLAWLWPMAETYRKTARTFAAQLRLIEQYPDYKYLQSQPAAYEMCRKYYPELFDRIKEAIKGGQWIAEGAMWVEPDTNMASGEALIRQLLYGKQYYKEVLGVDSIVLWLPDTFGYTAALPQILNGCGVKYLVTQKIFWSYNEGDTFPYHYFIWEGMDGSKITAFLPTSYTYRTDPSQLDEVWKGRSQVRDLDAFLLPYGYGDGGGGPSRDYIEYALRQKNLEGAPKVKLAGPVEFFEDMEKDGGPVNTYTGELYFSAHRGTYTSQAKVKYNNRRAELALRDMEIWGVFASLQGDSYDIKEAGDCWKELLLHQFHDILPGSGIQRMYIESNERMEKLIHKTTDITRGHIVSLCELREDAVTIFNSLSFETTRLVELPERFKGGAVYVSQELSNSSVIPVQVQGNKALALIKMPPLGAVTIKPIAGNSIDATKSIDVPKDTDDLKNTNNPKDIDNLKNTNDRKDIDDTDHALSRAYINGSDIILENTKVRAVINPNGEITSFILKDSDIEFASGVLNRFHIYKDVPRLFDAWDIDSNYKVQEMEGVRDTKAQIIYNRGLKASVKITGLIGNSSYEQIISLTAESDRIEFETDIEWHELHRLLKTEFATTVHATEGINEMQFGYVKRPTHRSRAYDKDRFEVCNHRYSALCDGGRGAAVLNDCKYGISMNGSSLELTLLRAAASPEMRADNGHHHFTYAFTAWEGSFIDSDVIREGYELNVRPIVIDGYEPVLKSSCEGCYEKLNVIEADTAADTGKLTKILKSYNSHCSLASIDKKNIFLDTIKLSEDGSGDIILRLYEAAGAATKAKITTCFKGKAYESNMLEEITALEEPSQAGDDINNTVNKENLEKVTCLGNGILDLDFRAFEVKTIRIIKSKA